MIDDVDGSRYDLCTPVVVVATASWIALMEEGVWGQGTWRVPGIPAATTATDVGFWITIGGAAGEPYVTVDAPTVGGNGSGRSMFRPARRRRCVRRTLVAEDDSVVRRRPAGTSSRIARRSPWAPQTKQLSSAVGVGQVLDEPVRPSVRRIASCVHRFRFADLGVVSELPEIVRSWG